MLQEQAPIIIYKTKKDYYNHVPVTLNDEKNKIISFPGPNDLLHDGEPALPIKLDKGFLLDVRGLHPNTAFTGYTYDAYSQLSAPPSVDDLYESIIDNDPFVAYYECGRRASFSKDLTADLNRIIKDGFKGCDRIK
ncbi:MAG: hypothetical protein K9J30_06135 [Bacteroidales bacterium]|nr:hypothetical protein [Bacteroidales bacterium]